MTIASPPRTETVEDLRSRVRGGVHVPGDRGYDAARAGFNLLFDQRPGVIVVPADSADVVHAVRFAAAAQLRVAVQATGHGIGRSADGALMIATSEMTDVTIDPVNRTAQVSAGARWGRVLEPAQEHGLAPLMGSTTDVGAVGYTLGGGLGWLARRYGLGSDSVRSFDLVTPDGTPLRASEVELPEVFWALKGGGGGTLGVVTGMEIDLYPISTVYAGNLFYPAEQAAEIIRRWRDWAPAQGEELTSSVLVMNFPPLPEVPEALRGRSFTVVRGCWSGAVADGAAMIDAWREWQPPLLDLWTEMPFAASDLISNDPHHPLPAMVTTEWFEELPDAAIDIVVNAALPRPGFAPALVVAEFRHAGGAVRRQAAAAANDLGRTGEFLLELIAVATVPQAVPVLQMHLRQTRRLLEPFVTGAAYLNFLEGTEKQARSVSAYSPPHLERLRRVKAALDPDNRFCHGFGVIS